MFNFKFRIMKKILFILLPAFLLVSCKSREEKVAELIKQEMFKTLYDFESYEPVETKIDSAFTSIYTDSVIKSYAYIARSFLDDVQEGLDKVKDAQRTAEIWRDSYSSYGRIKYEEACNEMRNHLDEVKSKMSIVNSYTDSIRNASVGFKPEFCGWRVKHRFRCKTKGGNFDLGDYVYIVDKKVTKIIYKEDPDDEYTKKVNGLIEEAINSKNEQEETDSVTDAASNI